MRTVCLAPAIPGLFHALSERSANHCETSRATAAAIFADAFAALVNLVKMLARQIHHPSA
jgi:hypothetical protein